MRCRERGSAEASFSIERVSGRSSGHEKARSAMSSKLSTSRSTAVMFSGSPRSAASTSANGAYVPSSALVLCASRRRAGDEEAERWGSSVRHHQGEPGPRSQHSRSSTSRSRVRSRRGADPGDMPPPRPSRASLGRDRRSAPVARSGWLSSVPDPPETQVYPKKLGSLLWDPNCSWGTEVRAFAVVLSGIRESNPSLQLGKLTFYR